MIYFDKVGIGNAMNVAYLLCSKDGGGLKPVYFHLGYKSEIDKIVDNAYRFEGDGGGFPKIVVNILDKVKERGKFVDVDIEVIGGMSFLRGEGGVSSEKSENEIYNELYGMIGRFKGYLEGMKHTKNGVRVLCFDMGDMSMLNDGYKINDEILVVEGMFRVTVQKPKNWECQLRGWADGVVPSYLSNVYDPTLDNPFKNFDVEYFKN